MILPGIATVILVSLVVAVAGGVLLRTLGRVAVALGLLGTVLGGGAIGLLIAAAGALMVALGRSRPLDRRRRHACAGSRRAGPSSCVRG
jgi:hypothetical protein